MNESSSVSTVALAATVIAAIGFASPGRAETPPMGSAGFSRATYREKLVHPVQTKGGFCFSNVVTRPLPQRGADGTTYMVHFDFTRGAEKLNSYACGREYWLAPSADHRFYGIVFVYLVDGSRRRVSEQLFTENPDGSLEIRR